MSGGASSNGGGGVPSGGVSSGVGSGYLDSAANAPVFCFGDRILLELQTQQGATSFLGLDDWASESSSLLEAPPISVLTTEMPKAREERQERQLPLPPMMEGMKLSSLKSEKKQQVEDDAAEFYAENCVFELYSPGGAVMNGKEVRHGASRLCLRHVTSSKYLVAQGDDESAALVLQDPDKQTNGPPGGAQLFIQPLYASRVRGDRVEHNEYIWIEAPGTGNGVRVQKSVAVNTPDLVVTMSGNPSGFLMRLFTKYEAENKSLVKGGDVIRLKHTVAGQDDMYLRGEYGAATDIANDNERATNQEDNKTPGNPPMLFDPQVLLDNLTCQVSDEPTSHELRDLFLVEMVSEVWNIAGKPTWTKQLAGQPLAWNSKIRFRHLPSNKYLHLDNPPDATTADKSKGLTLVDGDTLDGKTGGKNVVFQINSTQVGATKVLYTSRLLFSNTEGQFLESTKDLVTGALKFKRSDERSDGFSFRKVRWFSKWFQASDPRL
jgi:hypothetical protein